MHISTSFRLYSAARAHVMRARCSLSMALGFVVLCSAWMSSCSACHGDVNAMVDKLDGGQRAMLEHGPKQPTPAQAISWLMPGHPVRIVVDMRTLRRHHVLEPLLGLIPPPRRRVYDDFKEAAGFDPVQAIDSVVMASTARTENELDAGGSGYDIVVFSRHSVAIDAIRGMMSKVMAKHSVENEDRTLGTGRAHLVAFMPISKDARDLLATLADDSSNWGMWRGAHGNLLTMGTDSASDAVIYFYAWEYGMVIGKMAEDGTHDVDAAVHDLMLVLRGLSYAAAKPASDASLAKSDVDIVMPKDGRKVHLGINIAHGVFHGTNVKLRLDAPAAFLGKNDPRMCAKLSDQWPRITTLHADTLARKAGLSDATTSLIAKLIRASSVDCDVDMFHFKSSASLAEITRGIRGIGNASGNGTNGAY